MSFALQKKSCRTFEVRQDFLFQQTTLELPAGGRDIAAAAVTGDDRYMTVDQIGVKSIDGRLGRSLEIAPLVFVKGNQVDLVGNIADQPQQPFGILQRVVYP